MPRFFENISAEINGEISLDKANSQHIIKSLRMSKTDILTVCSGGVDYECEIVNTSADMVICRVKNKTFSASEPSLQVTLFQCLPKNDKFETVIQKSVELGVCKIVPVMSERCISRPDEKKSAKKLERYNKIAHSACEQSGRGKIITVSEIMPFKTAINMIKDEYELGILFYEGGGESLKKIIGDKSDGKVAIFIGPEGGFAEKEVEYAKENGLAMATLGKRILRTETAPLAALTAIMLLSGNLE